MKKFHDVNSKYLVQKYLSYKVFYKNGFTEKEFKIINVRKIESRGR